MLTLLLAPVTCYDPMLPEMDYNITESNHGCFIYLYPQRIANISAKHALVLLGESDDHVKYSFEFLDDEKVVEKKIFEWKSSETQLYFVDGGKYTMRIKLLSDSVQKLYVYPFYTTKRYFGSKKEISINLEKNETAFLDLMPIDIATFKVTPKDVILSKIEIDYPMFMNLESNPIYEIRGLLSVAEGKSSGSYKITCTSSKDNFLGYSTSDDSCYAMYGDTKINPISGSGLTGGQIAGIVIGIILGIALIVGAVFAFMWYKKILFFKKDDGNNVDTTKNNESEV